MDKIYVLKKGSFIRGPYTLKDLEEKGIDKNDMAWYEGLEDWTPIKELTLFDKIKNNHKPMTKKTTTFFGRLFKSKK